MARNIEIKAQASNFAQQLTLGANITDAKAQIIQQTDTFFHSTKGRLKLRECPDQAAQLIYYTRSDQAGPKLSNYHITNTENGTELKHTLSQTMGVMATVRKSRTLLMHGRTRLHFDQVHGLGDFIELEVVLKDTDDVQSGEQEANRLMQLLCIQPADLIEQAYVDLLLTEPIL